MSARRLSAVSGEIPSGSLADTLRRLEGRLPALPPAELADVKGAAARLGALADAQLAMLPLRGRPKAADGLEHLRAEDVAKLLRVSRSRVYDLARGELKPAAVWLGEGTLRFDRRALERLLEARRGWAL